MRLAEQLQRSWRPKPQVRFGSVTSVSTGICTVQVAGGEIPAITLKGAPIAVGDFVAVQRQGVVSYVLMPPSGLGMATWSFIGYPFTPSGVPSVARFYSGAMSSFVDLIEPDPVTYPYPGLLDLHIDKAASQFAGFDIGYNRAIVWALDGSQVSSVALSTPVQYFGYDSTYSSSRRLIYSAGQTTSNQYLTNLFSINVDTGATVLSAATSLNFDEAFYCAPTDQLFAYASTPSVAIYEVDPATLEPISEIPAPSSFASKYSTMPVNYDATTERLWWGSWSYRGSAYLGYSPQSSPAEVTYITLPNGDYYLNPVLDIARRRAYCWGQYNGTGYEWGLLYAFDMDTLELLGTLNIQPALADYSPGQGDFPPGVRIGLDQVSGQIVAPNVMGYGSPTDSFSGIVFVNGPAMTVDYVWLDPNPANDGLYGGYSSSVTAGAGGPVYPWS